MTEIQKEKAAQAREHLQGRTEECEALATKEGFCAIRNALFALARRYEALSAALEPQSPAPDLEARKIAL
jgi:hypothetical protein